MIMAIFGQTGFVWPILFLLAIVLSNRRAKEALSHKVKMDTKGRDGAFLNLHNKLGTEFVHHQKWERENRKEGNKKDADQHMEMMFLISSLMNDVQPPSECSDKVTQNYFTHLRAMNEALRDRSHSGKTP